MACEARQYSDQMQCGRCGLAWDMNDPDPPECGRRIDRRAIPDRRVTRAVARVEPAFGAALAVTTAQIPVELSEPVALEMADVYEKARGRGLGGIEAMRAAYSAFLSRLP